MKFLFSKIKLRALDKNYDRPHPNNTALCYAQL